MFIEKIPQHCKVHNIISVYEKQNYKINITLITFTQL